jgi:hypothetical protein
MKWLVTHPPAKGGGFLTQSRGVFRVGNADAINATYCQLLHRADGYGYARPPALPPPAEAGGLQCGGLG